ncbi:MAG: exostosin family protein [Gammaproteobacteria bacterium]|nr:exostosin family protein [Gammaproteobacteria bacterium]
MISESHQPLIFAKFVDQDILSEMGRLLFYTLNIFALNGYHIKLFQNINFEKLEKDRPYIRLVESIDNLVMVDEIPGNTEDTIYLFDREDKECAQKHWKKRIQIRFNIFSSYFWSAFSKSRPIVMPYPMHPLLYGADLESRLQAGRQQKRTMRIFFSGDTEGYRKNRIHYPTKKLTRSEIIGTITEVIGDNAIRVTDTESHNRLLGGEYIQKFVIVDNKEFRIESRYWLETLSKSDFFLCPPGYVMPMCHNVIEAMSVGTIPVINYPEWLNPSLTDMVNCVAFDDKDELIRKINHILNMKEEEINEMRSRVIEYYQNNLDPEVFVNKLEMNTEKDATLLMVTDAYVAKNSSKLNRNSIIINGTPLHPRTLWSGIRRSLTSG